ncbi:MAG TPA: tetratricopeptide repeat protein, partial [Candidatus Hydrogenedentes bacterium]|nr:tetratricopeptide repeat protein [Candidatus Hydrogenedentota bacterium]
MITRLPRWSAATRPTPQGRVLLERGCLASNESDAPATGDVVARSSAVAQGMRRIALYGAAVVMLLALSAGAAQGAEAPPGETVELEPIAAEPAPAMAPDAAPNISQAEHLFRQGVELYNKNQFREALNLFNRALQLEPGHEQAKAMRDKCQA